MPVTAGHRPCTSHGGTEDIPPVHQSWMPLRAGGAGAVAAGRDSGNPPSVSSVHAAGAGRQCHRGFGLDRPAPPSPVASQSACSTARTAPAFRPCRAAHPGGRGPCLEGPVPRPSATAVAPVRGAGVASASEGGRPAARSASGTGRRSRPSRPASTAGSSRRDVPASEPSRTGRSPGAAWPCGPLPPPLTPRTDPRTKSATAAPQPAGKEGLRRACRPDGNTAATSRCHGRGTSGNRRCLDAPRRTVDSRPRHFGLYPTLLGLPQTGRQTRMRISFHSSQHSR
jgi:hypothetical protein